MKGGQKWKKERWKKTVEQSRGKRKKIKVGRKRKKKGKTKERKKEKPLACLGI